MDKESDNNIVIFPSSWIDPISVQNPFTTINNYEELYKNSPFNASIKSFCISLANISSSSVNMINDHSFISKQLALINNV
jgi:hypothetical protein